MTGQRFALLGSTILVSFIWSASAMGQIATPAPPAEQLAEDEDEQDSPAIVVTGSRLQNQGFNAPTPVTVIGGDLIQQRAASGVQEVLNDIPSFRLSSGSGQGQRLGALGPSQSLVDLRGLGASRTLVLVDGRRFVGTNTGGSVDTSLIPALLVDRIDVVTGGASAAYGSDAVAGVSNFILKERLTGFQASVVGGISWQGDNREFGASAAGGSEFLDGRLHVMAGVEYNRNWGVGNIYERDWSSIEPGNTNTPLEFGANRPAGTPAKGFLPFVEYSTQTRGSVINSARTATGVLSNALNQIAFNPDGSQYQLVRGQVYGILMTGVTTNYRASPVSNWTLRIPTQRLVAMGRMTYELSDTTRGFLEFNYGKGKVFVQTSFHQTPSAIILRDNPYLPENLRSQMAALNLTQIDIGRLDTDWAGTTLTSDFNTVRAVGGLKGKIFSDWDWDMYVQYGRTKIYSETDGTRESNLQAAMYAVRDANNNIVCGPVATNPNFAVNRRTALIDPSLVLPGCQPFNPFGIGRNSQATVNYVSGVQTTDTLVKQTVVAANISGSPFSLWAGPVSVATGGEIRWDKLKVVADPLAELGVYSFGNFKSYGGSNRVWEVYAELGVPLVKDVPLFKAVDLNGAIRRTNYRNSGAVVTWKGGATWDVVDALRFRVTRSRDIRAPNLTELFNIGGTSASASVTNPFNGQIARLPTVNRGNPNLRPEIADTWTAGVVLQPDWNWARGLRLSVDYYDIKVKEVIAAVSGIDVLNRCYQGITEYCSSVEFDNSTYGVRLVRVGSFNQAFLNTRGIDFEVSYRVPDSIVPGRLDLRLLASHAMKLERIDRVTNAATGATTLVGVDYAGSVNGPNSIGVPSWSGTFMINYATGPVLIGLQARTFSSFLYDPRLKGPDNPGYNPASADSININRFPSRVYFNGNIAYDFKLGGHDLQVFGIVNNIFDNDPPALAIAAINSGGNPYDYVGRTFRAGLRLKW